MNKLRRLLGMPVQEPSPLYDAIHDLGCAIDDGEIIFEKPNQHPLKLGFYNGETCAPDIVFDFSCRQQVNVAKFVKDNLKARGYQPQLISNNSYGQLSRELEEHDRWIATLREERAA